MHLTVLALEGSLPGCRSLKEKRGIIKPILSGLRREFGLSAAEIGHQDDWDRVSLACAIVSSDSVFNDRVLQHAVTWLESRHTDLVILQVHHEER